MSSATQLSSKDLAVLGALFDPEASLSRNRNITEDPEASVIPHVSETAKALEQRAIKILDDQSPSQANVEKAIAQLSSIIEFHPGYASAFANRAQAYRLHASFDRNDEILSKIFTDLNAAIVLATPTSPLTPVSQHDARVLASAHTHRGYLLLRASTAVAFRNRVTSLSIPMLANVNSAASFEELASRDFSVAGQYGNRTAQQIAVKTNPYAKLCGQIVKEALQREIKEFHEGIGTTVSTVH